MDDILGYHVITGCNLAETLVSTVYNYFPASYQEAENKWTVLTVAQAVSLEPGFLHFKCFSIC